MEFRRLERQYLLPRSEVAYQSRFWSSGGAGEIQSRDGAYLSVFEPFAVGMTEDRAYSVTLYWPGRHHITVIPLGEGPAPVPVNSVIARVPEPGRVWMSGCNLLFLQVPREMARAELDVDVTLFNDEQFSRRAQEGLCLEDGVWLCFPWNHRREGTPETGMRERRIPSGCTGRMGGSFWSRAAS